MIQLSIFHFPYDPMFRVRAEPGRSGKIGHFYEKSRKTWNGQGVFYNFCSSEGKIIAKWLLYLLSVIINFISLHSAIASTYMYIFYLLGSIFCTYFCK